MPTLHLGVLDIPYQGESSAPARAPKEARRKRRNDARAPFSGRDSGAATTGDVAEILEGQYHVMEHFWEAHGAEIADEMAASMQAFFEDRLSGSPANAVSFADAESKIGEMFRKFLGTKEMDGLGYPGIPTQAARKGVNHRLKHPYAKGNPARPSFVDTGTYSASFRAEFEE